MITVDNLSKSFWERKRGEIKAVSPVSFEIEKGEIFGLLGPNGAGKTTLLRMLATILTPSSGTAFINGFDLRIHSNEIKKSIGFLSGNTKLYGRLTPKELLYYFGALYDLDHWEITVHMNEIFDMLNMHEFSDQKIENLSTGQVQKTSIARCILHDPAIYILDEPTLGLDILTSQSIIQFIKDAASNGKTVIFSTHHMQEVELLCHRIGLLHFGQILDIDSLTNYKIKTDEKLLSDIFLKYITNANQEH